jgi:hypothetical protein
MAKFYNCSDQYLWKRGIAPLLNLLYIGLAVYLVIIFIHKPIVNFRNTTVTLSWAAFTLFLFIYWRKRVSNLNEIIIYYTQGYIGELFTRLKLAKLPASYRLLYDVKIPNLNGNIDYVIICDRGIFTLEIKTVNYYNQKTYQHDRFQSITQAVELDKFLSSKASIKNLYIHPVLIYYKTKSWTQYRDDRVEILGRNDTVAYFNKNMPARLNILYNESEINELVSALYKK